MDGDKIKRNFVVAHSLEARPIIDLYGLSKSQDAQGFNVFEKGGVRLVVSGQGQVNCAAATGYLAGRIMKSDALCLWINVGIAGHEYHPIGSLFRANKIIDSSTRKCYFPGNLLRVSKINGAAVMTVSEPENEYPQDCLYDMEASAFFVTACRVASIEHINSFKIISDNKDNSLKNFKSKDALAMIKSQVENIDEYLNELENNLILNINESFQDIEFKDFIFNEYRLTHSQKEQVESLLSSLSAHGIKLEDDWVRSSKAEEFIGLLKARLSQVQLMV